MAWGANSLIRATLATLGECFWENITRIFVKNIVENLF
jgi:hypothetical protein